MAKNPERDAGLDLVAASAEFGRDPCKTNFFRLLDALNDATDGDFGVAQRARMVETMRDAGARLHYLQMAVDAGDGRDTLKLRIDDIADLLRGMVALAEKSG